MMIKWYKPGGRLSHEVISQQLNILVSEGYSSRPSNRGRNPSASRRSRGSKSAPINPLHGKWEVPRDRSCLLWVTLMGPTGLVGSQRTRGDSLVATRKVVWCRQP